MKLRDAINLVVVASLAAVVGYAYAKGTTKTPTWTPAADVKWSPLDPSNDKGPHMSVVFGDVKKKGPVGVLLKIPQDTRPGMHSHSSDYYSVVLTGTEHDWVSGAADEGPAMAAGSWWFQPGKVDHDNHCEAGADCTIFIYMPSGFDMKPAKATVAKAPAPAAAEPEKAQ